MVLSKEQAKEIIESVGSVRDTEAIKVHREVLFEKHTRDEGVLADISNKLVMLGKGLFSSVVYKCKEHGLIVKAPSFRAYLSIDGTSDLPYVRLTVSSTPTFKFSFKETLNSRLDLEFEEEFINFLDTTIYEFIATAIAKENVEELNKKIDEIKGEIEEDELTVPFDLSFDLSEKSIVYISNDKLVLGTNYDKMLELTGANSTLDILFNKDESTEYVAEAVKSKIKEDWLSSSNPLVFVRKHNQYLIPFVTGNLNTRRTHRVDVLIRKSFTLSVDSLKYRKKAIAHKIEKDGDETYISLYKKDSKEEEPVQILSPVNIKSLTYKG